MGNKAEGSSNIDDIIESENNQKLLAKRLEELYREIIKNTERNKNKFRIDTMLENVPSRDNLLTYLALRQHNIEELQMKLAEEGLSSLGRLV